MPAVIDAERVHQEAQRGEFDYFVSFLREHDQIHYQLKNGDRDLISYGYPKYWWVPSDKESLFYYLIKYNRKDIFDMMTTHRQMSDCFECSKTYWYDILKYAIYLQNKDIEALALPYILCASYMHKLPTYFCEDPILFVHMYQIIERIRKECPETHPTSPVCFRCKECRIALECQLKHKVFFTDRTKSEWFYNPEALKLFEQHCLPIAEKENAVLLQYSRLQLVKATGVILELVLETLPKDVIDFVIVPYL